MRSSQQETFRINGYSITVTVTQSVAGSKWTSSVLIDSPEGSSLPLIKQDDASHDTPEGAIQAALEDTKRIYEK